MNDKKYQLQTETSAAGGMSGLTDVLAADSKRALELLGSIFYCGNFVAETRNEQELESLMRKHGYFIETEAQFDAYCQLVHEAANAEVSGAGMASAGLKSYTA